MKAVLITLLTLVSFSTQALVFRCKSAIHPPVEGDELQSVVLIKIPENPDELIEKVIKENELVKIIFRYGKDHYTLNTVDVETGNDLGFAMTELSSPSLMLFTPVHSPKMNAWASCIKI